MSIDTTPPTAAVADRYRLERELGRGGYSSTGDGHGLHDRDLKQDRLVALKVLYPELAH